MDKNLIDNLPPPFKKFYLLCQEQGVNIEEISIIKKRRKEMANKKKACKDNFQRSNGTQITLEV